VIAAALAAALAGALAAQGVLRGAEAFPPGAPAPGYAGVRVRVDGGARAVLRLSVDGGSSTTIELEASAGGARDVVAAVWRAEARAIRVELGAESAIVDPGPPRETVLAVGELADAEAASDAFGCGLPDVLLVKTLPELLDPMALDGFAGVASAGVPSSVAAGLAARGGAVVGPRPDAGWPGPWSDAAPAWPALSPSARVARAFPRLPVNVAAAAPPEGLAPRDAFGPSSLPIRLLLAAAIVGAALCAALRRRPRTALAAAGATALAATAAVALAARAREAPRAVFLRAGAEIGLELAAAPGEGALSDAAVFPCGAGASLARTLGPGSDRWSARGAVLLARPRSRDSLAGLQLVDAAPPRFLARDAASARRDPSAGVWVLARSR